MGLVIHNEKINQKTAGELVKICPFSAISYDGELSISSACKMCKLCVKKDRRERLPLRKKQNPSAIRTNGKVLRFLRNRETAIFILYRWNSLEKQKSLQK